MVINKLLARKAAMPPGKVELMIHHVVDTFHINMDTYVQMKKFLLLMPCISIQNNGTKATKMRKVSGDTGHAANSNKPEANERMPGCILFNFGTGLDLRFEI